MERDPFKIQKENIVYNFNSHAHVERDADIIIITLSVDDFNSHAHVERDNVFCYQGKDYCISTHTLTWSVTGKQAGNPV